MTRRRRKEANDRATQALRATLQSRRAQVDPSAHGLYRSAPQGRRAEGLGCAQRDINTILGLGSGTYERIESGQKANEYALKAVAELFGLNAHEWALLWHVTCKSNPPYPLPSREWQLPGEWQTLIDCSPHPGYITTRQWEIVTYNHVFPAIFPDGEVPRNSMEWMLLDPAAREVLGRWETAWAPLVTPQLWAARAAEPDDVFLADLERRVLADPAAGPIYREFGPVYVHPDGAVRPFNHPVLGPGWVSICSSLPRSSSRFINLILLFTPGEDAPPAVEPLRAFPRTS